MLPHVRRRGFASRRQHRPKVLRLASKKLAPKAVAPKLPGVAASGNSFSLMENPLAGAGDSIKVRTPCREASAMTIACCHRAEP